MGEAGSSVVKPCYIFLVGFRSSKVRLKDGERDIQLIPGQDEIFLLLFAGDLS